MNPGSTTIIKRERSPISKVTGHRVPIDRLGLRPEIDEAYHDPKSPTARKESELSPGSVKYNSEPGVTASSGFTPGQLATAAAVERLTNERRGVWWGRALLDVSGECIDGKRCQMIVFYGMER